MTDLRTAAQQALEALEDFRFAAGFDRPLAQDAIDALRAALAQQDEPAQEPVGYLPTYELNRLQSGHDGRLRSAKFGPSSLDEDVALYTAPPQRQPLTEEEIRRIIACIDKFTTVREGMRQLARAIERAHGIGEQP